MKTSFLVLAVLLLSSFNLFSNDNISTDVYVECDEPGIIEYTYSVNELSEREFNVELTLISQFADFFSVTTRNWDLGLAFIKNYEVQEYIKITSMNFYYGDEIQFQVQARNQCGFKQTYINLPLIYYQDALTSTTSVSENNINFIEVFSIMGRYVGSVNLKSDIADKFDSGIYILKYKDHDGNVIKTEKVINR